jgi:crossover junction endodeoxyribonuclease RusA
MIELTLPYPISANRYWRSFVPKGHSRAIVTLSDEAKAFKQEVGWLALKAGVRQPIDVRSEIFIRVWPNRPQDWAKRAARNPFTWDDDVQCIDGDNAIKVLLDALKGVVIVDDSRRYAWRTTVEHQEPDAGGARTVVTITPLPRRVHPQRDLLGEPAEA